MSLMMASVGCCAFKPPVVGRRATRDCSLALAAPDSIAALASRYARFHRELATFAAYSATPALRVTISLAGPSRLSSTPISMAMESCAVSTLSERLLTMGIPEILGMNFVFPDLTVLELADQGGSAERHLVHAITAVHHDGMLCPQTLQSTHLDTHEVGMEQHP